MGSNIGAATMPEAAGKRIREFHNRAIPRSDFTRRHYNNPPEPRLRIFSNHGSLQRLLKRSMRAQGVRRPVSRQR